MPHIQWLSGESIIQSQCTCQCWFHPSLLQSQRPELQSQRDSDFFHPLSVFSKGLIEISAVDRGIISLYGVRSGLFVAMNSRGRLYGAVGFFVRSSGLTLTHSLTLYLTMPRARVRAHNTHTHTRQCKMSSRSCFCIGGFKYCCVINISWR